MISPVHLSNSIIHYYKEWHFTVADVNKIVYIYNLMQINKGIVNSWQFLCNDQAIMNMNMPAEVSLYSKWGHCSIGKETVAHLVMCAGEKRPQYYNKKDNIELWEDLDKAIKYSQMIPFSEFTSPNSSYSTVKNRGEDSIIYAKDLLLDNFLLITSSIN